jgi:hypothetical protein
MLLINPYAREDYTKGDFEIYKGLTTDRVTSTIGHLDLLIGPGLRLLTAFNGRPESSGYHLDIYIIYILLYDLHLPTLTLLLEPW